MIKFALKKDHSVDRNCRQKRVKQETEKPKDKAEEMCSKENINMKADGNQRCFFCLSFSFME